MVDSSPSLDALREEIDIIDDQIHDLLMRRAEMARMVAAAKAGQGPVLLRPGREAAVLRRLLGRHQGAFPSAVVVRLWREIFSAIVAMQGPYSMAVCIQPDRGGHGFVELARNQYGSNTPMTIHQSASQVVQEVWEGRASVGVLPLPQAEDSIAWWPSLLSQLSGTPRVIGRLPFFAGDRGGLEALCVACLEPEPSGGEDHGLIAVDSGPNLSRASLVTAFEDAGFDTLGVMDVRPLADGTRLTLVEVWGFVAQDDPRLHRLEGLEGTVGGRAVVVGSYAQPVGFHQG